MSQTRSFPGPFVTSIALIIATAYYCDFRNRQYGESRQRTESLFVVADNSFLPPGPDNPIVAGSSCPIEGERATWNARSRRWFVNEMNQGLDGFSIRSEGKGDRSIIIEHPETTRQESIGLAGMLDFQCLSKLGFRLVVMLGDNSEYWGFPVAERLADDRSVPLNMRDTVRWLEREGL